MADQTGFHTENVKSTCVFLITFLFLFFNTSLIAAFMLDYHTFKFGSKQFYTIYASIITSSVMTTGLLQYFLAFTRLGMLKKNHRSDDTFSIEARSASLLSSLFIVYLYGPGIPYLYLYSFIVYILVYFADRYLLFYYFKLEQN